MAHRIKIRVNLKTGKTQKLSFNIEEGQHLRLFGETPGLAIFAALTGDPQKTACKATIREGVLVISSSSSGGPLQFNDQSTQETKVRVGDQLHLEFGSVEFLEVPLEEVVSDTTRFVSLNEADSTRVVQKSEAQASESTRYIQSQNTPDGATGMIMRSQLPDKSTDGATGMIMRGRTPEEAATKPGPRKTTRAKAEVKRTPEPVPHWKHFALSLAMIGISVEAAIQIAYSLKSQSPALPIAVSGLIGTAIFSAISGAFFYANRFWGDRGSLATYLRSFGYFSLALVPYSLAFAFPPSVVVFASLIIAAFWIFVFAVKYFDSHENFITISSAVWLAIIVIGHHSLTRPSRQREIASTPPPVAAEPQIASGSATVAPDASQTQPPPVATAAPMAVAAPVTPTVSKVGRDVVQPQPQEQSNGTIDPMAVDQFFNAVKSGNIKLVRSIVDKHVVDPIFTLQNGSSALHFAAAQGDLGMVKYLTSKRVNIDAQDAGGTTPLMWATYRHHKDVVEFLLSKKAKPDVRRDGGDRAVDIARRNHDKKIMAMLEAASKSRALASTKKSDSSKKKKKKKKKQHKGDW